MFGTLGNDFGKRTGPDRVQTVTNGDCHERIRSGEPIPAESFPVSLLLQHRTARREENMVDSIPVDLLEKWLQDLRSILKADARKTKNNLLIDEGMLHGLDQVQHRITTWWNTR